MFTSHKFRVYFYLALPISLISMLLEISLMLSSGYRLDFIVSPVKYSTLLYSVCVILTLLSFKDVFSRLPKLIYKCGYYSYGIYLVHIMILKESAVLISHVNIISSFQPVLQLILVAVTIMMCMVIINVSHKLLPKQFCRKVLGF